MVRGRRSGGGQRGRRGGLLLRQSRDVPKRLKLSISRTRSTDRRAGYTRMRVWAAEGWRKLRTRAERDRTTTYRCHRLKHKNSAVETRSSSRSDIVIAEWPINVIPVGFRIIYLICDTLFRTSANKLYFRHIFLVLVRKNCIFDTPF